MILERQAELDAAARLLDDLPDGACAILFEGEPGIGKTAVIEAVAADAARRGIRVLSCRPSQHELELPHAGLIELLADVADAELDGLPEPQRRALMVALRRLDPGDVHAESPTVTAGLASLLADLARHRPLLLVLDDIHWLDAASAACLEPALRRAAATPVGVLAGARIGEGPVPRPAERAVPPHRRQRVLMGPLSDRTLAHLVRTRAPETPADDAVRRIVRAARGNPLAAIEMVRGLGEAGATRPGAPPTVPGDIVGLVSRRLASLPAGTRAALLRAACTGVGESLPGAADALAPAEAAGIVTLPPDGTVVFAHPLYRASVLSLSPAAERRGAHAELALATDDPERRAHHLAMAADGPDAGVAAALETAASRAASRGAPTDAADLLERAWRLTPPGDGAAATRRALRACELLAQAGHHAALPRILDLAGPALTGSAMGHALRLRAEAQVWEGRLADAILLLEESLQHLAADPAGAAEAHMDLVYAAYHAGRPAALLMEHAERAVARATEAGPDGPLAESLTVRAVSAWRTLGGIDEDALARAAALQTRPRRRRAHQRPRVVRAVMHGLAGDLTGAMDTLQRELDTALIIGSVGEVPYLAIYLGTFASMAGDADTLARARRDCAGAAEEMGTAMVRDSLLHLRLLEAAAAGDVAGAVALGDAALSSADQGDMRSVRSWIAWHRGRVALALGEPAVAAATTRPALAMFDPRRDNRPDPAFVPFVPDIAEAMALTGDTAGARGVLDPYERRCRELGRTWLVGCCMRTRALVHAAGGDLARAADLADEAVRILDGLGFPTELGRAHLALGGIARRLRRRGDARAAIQAAHAAFATGAAGIWRQRAEQELSRTWGTSASASLSPSELRMARLAAAGRSNPEIAARLMVSRRTVEATLGRVYRKLGIRGRGDLGRMLGDLPDPGGDA